MPLTSLHIIAMDNTPTRVKDDMDPRAIPSRRCLGRWTLISLHLLGGDP